MNVFPPNLPALLLASTRNKSVHELQLDLPAHEEGSVSYKVAGIEQCLLRARAVGAWQTNNLGRGLVDNSVSAYLAVALRGVMHGLTMCGGMRGGLPFWQTVVFDYA